MTATVRYRRALGLGVRWAATAAATGWLIADWTCLAYTPPVQVAGMLAHGAGIGLLLGIPQWLLLRRYLAVGRGWVPATLLGLLLGVVAAGIVGILGIAWVAMIVPLSLAARSFLAPAAIVIGAASLAAGAVIGLVQWWHLANRWLGQWVRASALGGGLAAIATVTAYALGTPMGTCGAWLPIGLLGGLAYGIATGAVLARLAHAAEAPRAADADG
jgi:hypothetical protein